MLTITASQPLAAADPIASAFLTREGFELRTDQESGAAQWVDTRTGESVRGTGDTDPIGDYLARTFQRDSSGNFLFGTQGVDYTRTESGTAPQHKTINGVDYIRTGVDPTQALASGNWLADTFKKFDPSLWGSYDNELGWFTAAPLAAEVDKQYLAHKDPLTWWQAFAQTIGVGLAFTGAMFAAGFAATAEAGAAATTQASAAAGATSSTAGGSIAGGSSAISTDFALVPPGSGVGIGGVGTSGLGLQVPATLGGAPTVGGLGLASTGAATTALLTPELLAPLGLEGVGLPGLTASQAAAAAAASGISAPATGASLWDQLTRAPTPSTSSGSSLSSTLNTLKTALGIGTTVAGLAGAGAGGSSGNKASTGASSRGGLSSIPLLNPSQWSTGEYTSIGVVLLIGVGIYAIAKHK